MSLQSVQLLLLFQSKNASTGYRGRKPATVAFLKVIDQNSAGANDLEKNGCQEKHHPLLHAAKPAESAVPVGVVRDQEYTVLMKTACVRVQGPEKAVDCVAYLDEGSGITLMKTSLAEEIGCEGETTPLRVLTLNGISEQVTKKVTANIQSSDTSQSFVLNPVYAVEHLPLGNPTPVSKNLENQFPELKGYQLPLQSELPSILIGLDHADLIACREVRPLSSNGPYLQKTLLGNITRLVYYWKGHSGR